MKKLNKVIKFIKKYVDKINLAIFPYALIFAFSLSVLESYKYFQIFSKHFNKLQYLVYLASFISFVFLVMSKKLQKKLKERGTMQMFLGVGTVVFFIFVLLYVVLNELEVFYYINYSYATFNIRPALLIFPVVLSFESAFLFFNANRDFVNLDKRVYSRIKSYTGYLQKVKPPTLARVIGWLRRWYDKY